MAVNEMKSGEARGLDGFPAECVKNSGETVERKFLYRKVPMDWRRACIVPLYKGKGNKC